MTFTEAAVAVLRIEGKPATYRKIAEAAVRLDLLTHVGNTPAETMQARIEDLLRRQGDACVFVEVRAGTYALREWGGSSPGPDEALAAKLRGDKKDREKDAAERAAEAPGPTASARGSRGRSGRRGKKQTATAPRPTARPTETATMQAESEGTPETKDAAGSPEAATTGAEPGAAATDAGAAEGGKRRRRRRRGGRKGPGAPIEPTPQQARPETKVAHSEPPAPPHPEPPARVETPEARAPEPSRAESTDLADAVTSLLRTVKGRRALRTEEIVREWASRNAPERHVPLAALAAALAHADASRRVGGTVFAATGGRWMSLESATGEEVAACERRTNATIAQQIAAVRRALLRRLMEIPATAFHQIVLAMLAAEGIRDVALLAERDDGGRGESVLLQARVPFGPAEINAIVLVTRVQPGRLVTGETLATLRGRLPSVGACQGIIVTTGRIGESMYRDLVPPNAIPLLAVEQDELLHRLIRHGIGVRLRSVEVPVIDPDAFGPAPGSDR